MFKQIYSGLIRLPESPRALMVLLAFAAFLMGTLFIARLNADLNYDGEIYIGAAMKLSSNLYREGLSLYPMPLYPLLISLVQNVVSNWIFAGRIISLFSMMFAVIPLYLLTKELFNSRAAFWCSTSYILLPETLYQSNTVMREPAFFLCFLLATFFAQRAAKLFRCDFLVYSALFGTLSTFFRIEGLIIFFSVFVFFFAVAIWNYRRSDQYLKLLFTWIAIIIVLVSTFFSFSNIFSVEGFNRYGDWIYYISGFVSGDILERYYKIADSIYQIKNLSPFRGVGYHIAETIMKILPLIYFLGLLQVLTFVIMVSNLIPLIIGLLNTSFSSKHVLTIFNALGLLAIAYGFFIRTDITMKRYVMISALLLMPWIGFGIDIILKRFVRFSCGKILIFCTIILLISIPFGGFIKYFRNPDDLATRAGKWIANVPELKSAKIVINNQVVKFHADILLDPIQDRNTFLYVDLHDDDFCKIKQFAVENHADFIVIMKREMDNENKNLNCLSSYVPMQEFSLKNKSIKIFKL